MPVAAIFELTGRRALVTGASRGIGKALAQALASAGADVAVTARSEASLAETVGSIEALGARAVAIGLDVSDAAACREGVARAAELLGGLDILVNNAGTEEVRPPSRSTRRCGTASSTRTSRAPSSAPRRARARCS
jgi:NAD(P)-dependent dehydrogenase (short-subunit alcohol dehydrogenase family)